MSVPSRPLRLQSLRRLVEQVSFLSGFGFGNRESSATDGNRECDKAEHEHREGPAPLPLLLLLLLLVHRAARPLAASALQTSALLTLINDNFIPSHYLVRGA